MVIWYFSCFENSLYFSYNEIHIVLTHNANTQFEGFGSGEKRVGCAKLMMLRVWSNSDTISKQSKQLNQTGHEGSALTWTRLEASPNIERSIYRVSACAGRRTIHSIVISEVKILSGSERMWNFNRNFMLFRRTLAKTFSTAIQVYWLPVPSIELRQFSRAITIGTTSSHEVCNEHIEFQWWKSNLESSIGPESRMLATMLKVLSMWWPSDRESWPLQTSARAPHIPFIYVLSPLFFSARSWGFLPVIRKRRHS